MTPEQLALIVIALLLVLLAALIADWLDEKRASDAIDRLNKFMEGDE